MYFKRFIVIVIISLFSIIYSLDKIDFIAAVVNDEIILFSELNAYTLFRLSSIGISSDTIDFKTYNRKFLNELIDGKILIAHGKKDSTITVTDDEIDQAMNNHITMLLQQNNMTIDSFEIELRRQQGISLSKFKSDARKLIHEQLIKQKIQQTYIYTNKVTKKDVEKFYSEYKDSLPKMGESILLSKLSLKISPSESTRQKAFEKIKSIKTRLDNGTDFSELARSFSDGPEAKEGGDLGFIEKGTLNELEFEENAFNLSPGQISDIFESRLGFHIIQMIEQRNTEVHIRQIFVHVEPTQESISLVTNKLDSIRFSCNTEKDFINAVKKYSEDPVSKANNGIMRWTSILELPSEIQSVVDSLPVGSITPPIRRNQFMSIFLIKNRVSERKLTLENDYQIIEKKAFEIISQKKLIELVSQWRKNIFINIRI